MEDSILKSTKKALGVPLDDDAFDTELVMYINGVFSELAQLGIGPVNGFMIEDESSKWVDFLGTDKNLNNVKTFIALKVRMIFDIPATGFAIDAVREQIKELTWRINVQREEEQWALPIDPTNPRDEPFADEVGIDGGDLDG